MILKYCLLHQIFAHKEAFNYLKRKENLILAEYKKGTVTKYFNPNYQKTFNHKNAHVNNNYKSLPNGNSRNYQNRIQNSQSYKNNNTINNKNVNNDGKYNGNQNKSYAFIEASTTHKPFELDVQINGNQFKALIDTGAGNTYIAKDLITKLDLTPFYTNPTTFETADARNITIDKKVSLEFKFNNIGDITYKIVPYVLETTGADLILGSTFLIDNEVVIDYKNKVLVVDNYYIDMPSIEEPVDNFDKKLMDKTKLYSLQETSDRTCFHLNSLIPEKLKIFLRESLKNNRILGTIPNYEYQIEVDGVHTHSANPYRVPILLRDKVNNEIQKLLDLKIISKSNSNFISPAFPILKKNGEIRLVVDFRHLNTLTEKIPYQLPNMTDLLSTFDNAKIFSSLDLTMGYHQVVLSQSTKYLTSFIINGQQYEYNRLPFGLVNAPLFFQRIMNNLIGDKKFVKIYLDDLIIFSKTEEQHIKDIESIILLLYQNNISINFSKSSFFKTSIKFLGNIVSASGISPDPTRIENFNFNFNIKIKKQLQSLLGFINWFRPYVRNLSQRLFSITEKLKDSVIKWTKENNNTIKEIIEEIKKGVLLHFPNYQLPFELYTDASEIAIGSILKQGNYIIGYYSYKLKSSERNYTVMEKEAFAILKSLDHFKTIICFAHIDVYTDNSNNLFYSNNSSKRIYRWKQLLNEYNYSLNFVPGIDNSAADFLSRIFSFSMSTSFNTNMLHKWQENDKKISQKINLKTHIVKGNITLLSDQNNRIVIPTQNFKHFFNYYHELLAHPGYKKFYETFKNYFITSNFLRKIKEYTKACKFCQKNKAQNSTKSYSKNHFFSYKYLDIVCSDIVGPFNTGGELVRCREKFYLLTFVDIFSRGL